MVNAFNPQGIWSPFGAFSMAVVQGEGHIVHLKGQVSLDVGGHVVGRGDIRAQVRKTLENIRDVLGSMGGRMSDIISLVHYATDIEAFMRTGDIRAEFFAAPYPVTTTVQIQRLYHPDLPTATRLSHLFAKANSQTRKLANWHSVHRAIDRRM